MKTLLWWASPLLAILAASPLRASPLIVESPDRGQTASDSSMLSQAFRWNPQTHEFKVLTTFSNLQYVCDTETRKDDTFPFLLPGVRYDAESQQFYATSADGRRMAVARWHKRFGGDEIQLLPNATLRVDDHGGNVSVALVVASRPIAAPSWQEGYFGKAKLTASRR
jgi:hypothetical protein